MRTHTRRRAAGMALLAAGLAFTVAPDMTAADAGASVYKPVLPDDVFAKLVNDDAKTIKDSLAKALDTVSVEHALQGKLGPGGYQLLGVACFAVMALTLFNVARPKA